MKSVSIVIPVLNEEPIIDDLMTRLRAVTEDLDYAFEFVVVDDGSRDGTLPALIAWQEREPRLTVIKLSRNWGHQNAYNAGIDHASNSDAVILMDGDLQDPPELIPGILEKWRQGFEVVFTVKQTRIDSVTRKILTAIYYWLVHLVTEVKLEKQVGMFSLLDRKVVAQLRRFTERNKSYPNLRKFVGFKQAHIPYHRGKRHAGKGKQNLRRLVNDALNAIFAFSYVPMRLITLTGLALTLIFAMLSVFVLFFRITDVEIWIFRNVPGWTSAILLILVVASFNLVFLGIIGEYIARIYDEVRNRPYYIVDTIYRPGGGEDTGA